MNTSLDFQETEYTDAPLERTHTKAVGFWQVENFLGEVRGIFRWIEEVCVCARWCM